MSAGRGLSRFTPEWGLTLIELLIALTILSVAIVGVVGMFPVAHQHLRVAGDLTKATALARRMVELLRNEPFQSVTRYHNADTRQAASLPADDPGGSPPFRGGSALHRWKEEIAAAPMGGGLYHGWGRIEAQAVDRGLVAVTVTVGWPASPTDRTVELTTYVAQE